MQYAVVEANEVLTSNDVNGVVNQSYFSDDSSRVRAIAGNGCITGVAEAYRQGNADEYRAALMQDAGSHGLKKEVIEKMKAPVLVRVMHPKDVRSDIGDRSSDHVAFDECC